MKLTLRQEYWLQQLSEPLPSIRCDKCGRFVAIGSAHRRLLEPDNAFGPESWETLCPKCKSKEDQP